MSLISKRTQKDRHAVVVMDGAGWYQQYTLNTFDNNPAYSLGLNPVEQVWQ